LASIPGIGTINATALVVAVGDGSAFTRGRDMATWLGLVPRQATTGGKLRLLGISKRGNRYLRKNLIHGARSVLPYLVERDTSLSRWVMGLMTRPVRFRQHLRAFYSEVMRPSIDPELMIRMLIVGYCMGIRSERRLCEEVHLNLAYRWFL
jgi:hypothetical protein